MYTEKKSNTPQVIITPTFDWLSAQAKACRSRLLVGSPYVNDGIINLTNLVSKDISRTLVTRTDLRDFALGASNLDTLCNLANDGIVIRSLSNLHAKMYIFDRSSALVTSANATFSGLYRNFECGLATDDRRVVRQLARSLLSGLGADRPPRKMRFEELESLHIPLRAIKASLPQPSAVTPTDMASPAKPTFSISDIETLVRGFKGWLRLTLDGVLAMPKGGFRLPDLVNECGSVAAKRYPKNLHVEAKLRQQLQRLRDVGIVEFVSPGRYRRTMS